MSLRFSSILSVALICLGLATASYGAMRDNFFEWQHDCMTTNGDSLDTDQDGVCEGLTIGWRFYTAEGAFITGIAEDGTRSYNVRYNMDWNTDQCHYMTAVMDDPLLVGGVLESLPSNAGACREVVPGDPKAPTQTRGTPSQ